MRELINNDVVVDQEWGKNQVQRTRSFDFFDRAMRFSLHLEKMFNQTN